MSQHDAAVFFGGDPVVDRGYTYRRFFADVQMYTDGPSIDPQQYLSGWSCGHIQQRENNWADGNNSRACNETYDQALAQLPRTMIGPERDQLVPRLNDIAVQDFYEIPLVTRGLVSAHANPLVGVGMNAWDSELWNIDEWSEVFGSERLTGALLDRLTHHVHILEMNGDSYRLKRSRESAVSQPSDEPHEE